MLMFKFCDFNLYMLYGLKLSVSCQNEDRCLFVLSSN